MIKHLFLLFLITACAASLSAQVEYKEEKVKITSIKKNSDYIYSEAYGDTYQEALETAEKGLYSEIKKLISENSSLQDADAIIVGTVKQNSAQIALKRGEMERVFLYVKKDHVFPKKNVMTMERTASVAVEELPQEVEPIMPVEKPTISAANPISVEEAIVAQEPVNSVEEAEVQAVVEKEIPVQETMAVDIAAIEEGEAIAPEAPSGKVITASPMLNEILSISDVPTLQQYMRAKKEDHKLIWGNVTSEVNPTWYVVVYSSAGIQAVLDKGINKRVNLLNGETQSLSDYKGYSKVWFLLYETNMNK